MCFLLERGRELIAAQVVENNCCYCCWLMLFPKKTRKGSIFFAYLQMNIQKIFCLKKFFTLFFPCFPRYYLVTISLPFWTLLVAVLIHNPCKKIGIYISVAPSCCSRYIYLRFSARVSHKAKWGAVAIHYGVPRKSVAPVWQKDLFRFLPIRARRY